MTVAKYRDHSFLPAELSKKIAKIDTILNKNKNVGQAGAPGSAPFAGRSGGLPRQGAVTTRPPGRKMGPEELLAEYSKRARPGTCSFCTQEGHWYKECAAFWAKCNEARAPGGVKKPVAAATSAAVESKEG